MTKAPITILIVASFLMTGIIGPMPAYAQDYYLPAPGVMVHLSPEFNPPILKGIKVHPDDPFRFDFILDKGDRELSEDQLKDESAKLIKYFLASITVPEKDLWVNLSPYEKDRIIPTSFGMTEMGRDLLAEDYMLKQITASLIYPEDAIGKKFWKRIYEEAVKKFGTTNIPVNTFNKVWIVPEKAVVFENAKAGTAYVVESKLKVMLEEDYLSISKHADVGVAERQPGGSSDRQNCRQAGCQASQGLNAKAPQGNNGSTNESVSALGSQIIREIVIPELTTEVNNNKNFAHLRQVYNSLILATWYKKKIKDSVLSQVYCDKNKVAGVNINDPQEKQRIYERYLRAFKKGVFNYIKEETDTLSYEAIPRKYFSGGVDLAMGATDLSLEGKGPLEFVQNRAEVAGLGNSHKFVIGVGVNLAEARANSFLSSGAQKDMPDHAMSVDSFLPFSKLTGEQLKDVRDVIKTWETPADQGGRGDKFFLRRPGELVWEGVHGADAIIAFQDGKAVAALSYWSKEGEVYENGIFVSQPARGQGVPLSLVLETLKHLKNSGYKKFHIGFAQHRQAQSIARTILQALKPAVTDVYRDGDIIHGIEVDIGKYQAWTVGQSGNSENSTQLPEDQAMTANDLKNKSRQIAGEVAGLIQAYPERFYGLEHLAYFSIWGWQVPTFLISADLFNGILNIPKVDLKSTYQRKLLALLALCTQYAIAGTIIQGGFWKNVIIFAGIDTAKTGLSKVFSYWLSPESVDFNLFNGIGMHGVKEKLKEIKEHLNRGELITLNLAQSEIELDQDNAMATNGGIDLTPANMSLQTKNNSGSIKFNLNPAQLAQLQNALGFVPVIINVQPLKSLTEFLGLKQESTDSLN